MIQGGATAGAGANGAASLQVSYNLRREWPCLSVRMSV